MHSRYSRALAATASLVVALGVASPVAAFQQCVLQPMHASGPDGARALGAVPVSWIRDALRLPADRATRLGAVTGDTTRFGPGQDLPYDLRKTSNVGRLQAEVYFQLARRAALSGAATAFVRSREWLWTYTRAAGVDSAGAPPSALNSLAHNQGMQLDFGRESVVRRVKKGPAPVFAMNVRTWWPEEDGPSKYTYQDTLTAPPLQVTSKRVITYRLLDLGDMVVYDKIEGSSGRPLEGFLSFLFDTFGEANLKQTRMALSEDGLLVVRGTGKWIINKSRTFVVHSDGSVHDIPDDRPDLQAIKERLERDLDIDYHDYDWGCDTRSPPLVLSVADDGTPADEAR